MVNECFQDDYAIGIMMALMSWCLVATACLVHPGIRGVVPKVQFYMLVLIICEIYAFFIIGYTFPGQAPYLSKVIKSKWYKCLVHTPGYRPCYSKRVASIQDIRLKFGCVNYYAQVTPLVVLQFEMEASTNMMLLLTRNLN